MLGDINYLIGPIKYDLMLTKPNKEPIIAISKDYENVYTPSMIAVDEFSFNIDKFYEDGSLNPSYDKIQEKYLIRINSQEYFIINEINEDNINGVKQIICYSLEFELSQKFIQTYEVISAKLYSNNSDIPGVMNLINSLAPSWTVGSIDAEILTKFRSFDVNNIDIYSFILKNIQEAFGCIAIFNTDDKTIDFKLLENVGVNQSLFLDKNNLINELNRNRKLENIATRVYAFGSEDLTMNTINPTGKSWIDNFSYYRNTDWMSQGLIDALDDYDIVIAANISEFQTVLNEYQTEFEDKYGSDNNNTLSVTLISGTNITFADNASDLDDYYTGWELLIEQPSSTNEPWAGQTATIIAYNGTTKVATLDSAFSIVQHTYNTVQVTVIEVPQNPVNPAIYADGTYFISESIGNYTHLQLSLLKQAYYQEYEIALIAKHASITPTQDDLDELAEIRTHLDYWNGKVITNQVLVDANDAVLNTKITRLQELNDLMDIENNLTFTELQELDSYIVETTYNNSTIIDETDLYNEALEISNRMAYPRYEFNLSASDFLTMVEYQHIRHRLKIGDIINVQISDTEVVEVRLLSYTHSVDEDLLDMSFSSVNSFLDSTYELSEILDNTSSSANTLNVERFKYKTYVDEDQNTILQYMDSALDAARNSVLAGNNQEIVIDRTGITLREYDSITLGYKDEQIRMINNTIAITDDNWNTVKTAISPTGVFADVLVGRAILGTELQIEAADGTFTVDDLGTVLKNMSLTAISDEGLGTERKIVLNGTDIIKVTIAGEDKLWIDGNGDLNITGNINMSASSTISWSNITDGDSNALSAWTTSGYSTYIDGTGIYTGTLVANKILTGTLGAPGETITLTSNVVIGAGFTISWTDVTNSSIEAVNAFEGSYMTTIGPDYVFTGKIQADKIVGNTLTAIDWLKIGDNTVAKRELRLATGTSADLVIMSWEDIPGAPDMAFGYKDKTAGANDPIGQANKCYLYFSTIDFTGSSNIDFTGVNITGLAGSGTELATLNDTNIVSPTDGQTLVYDFATSKWINSTPIGGSEDQNGLFGEVETVFDGTGILPGLGEFYRPSRAGSSASLTTDRFIQTGVIETSSSVYDLYAILYKINTDGSVAYLDSAIIESNVSSSSESPKCIKITSSIVDCFYPEDLSWDLKTSRITMSGDTISATTPTIISTPWGANPDVGYFSVCYDGSKYAIIGYKDGQDFVKVSSIITDATTAPSSITDTASLVDDNAAYWISCDLNESKDKILLTYYNTIQGTYFSYGIELTRADGTLTKGVVSSKVRNESFTSNGLTVKNVNNDLFVFAVGEGSVEEHPWIYIVTINPDNSVTYNNNGEKIIRTVLEPGDTTGEISSNYYMTIENVEGGIVIVGTEELNLHSAIIYLNISASSINLIDEILLKGLNSAAVYGNNVIYTNDYIVLMANGYWSTIVNFATIKVSAPSPTTLVDLTDTNVISPTDGQTLVYDDATSKWINSTPTGGSGVASGVDNFAGAGGTTVIAHGMGAIPSAVTITPSASTGGYLGEYWASFDATNIYVTNTGSSTASFSWIGAE